MKKVLCLLLIYQISYSQNTEVVFLDSNFNNVDNIFIGTTKKKQLIRPGKAIPTNKSRAINYYVDFEKDINGKVINEVILYAVINKRRVKNPYRENSYFEVPTFRKPEKREGVIVGKGYLAKINMDNFTNSIFKTSWSEFYLNGNLKKFISYNENGILDGEYKEYYENGNLNKTMSYLNGNLIGEYKEYFEDGMQNKTIIYLDGKIVDATYNINLNNNLKYFDDEDYIKAYIKKDGYDKLEGLYQCYAHIPIRGRNLIGEYKIAIVNYGRVKPRGTKYVAYILEADCENCEYWKKGDVLATFNKNALGEYDIHWYHPKRPNVRGVAYEENFGSINFTQIFRTKRKTNADEKIIFSLKAQYIKSIGTKEFNDDESVELNKIFPKINSTINNQNSSSNNENTITREEAIVLLKELKELLELGLITEKEFEKKSEELKEIILD